MKKKPTKRKGRMLLALYAGVLIATAPAATVWAALPVHAEEGSGLTVVSREMTIDGKSVKLPAANVQGSMYIGLRSLNEQLGLSTDWDPAKQTVTVTGRGRTASLMPENGEYTVNGQTFYGSPALLQEGSVYVPLRFLLEKMGYGISYDPSTGVVGIETIQENGVTVQTGAIEEEGDGWSVRIRYPQMTGYANSDIQNAINAYLKKEAETSAEQGKKELVEAADAFKESAADSNRTVPLLSSESHYTVSYNEKGLLSLYVDYYVYTGGAHGYPFRLPYTFDLSTGKRLSLADAAGGNPDYVSIVNDAIRTQIREDDLALLTPFETIEPDRPFFLKHDAVVVYFEPYEYTPYALGMPEFEIPFGALRE